MFCIVMPGVADSGKNMLLAKWVEHDRETVVVSLADEYVCLLSHPARVNGIKMQYPAVTM